MELYFIRHGQTEWNVLHKVQGRADISLNQNGIGETLITLKEMNDNNIKPDLIIYSPLKRTKQTALLLNPNQDIKMKEEKELIERDFGEFEGLLRSEFDFDNFWNYYENKSYKSAENIQDFFKRISNFLDKLYSNKDYQDKTILLVSHAGVSIAINCYLEGIIPKGCLKQMAFKNASIIKLNIKE